MWYTDINARETFIHIKILKIRKLLRKEKKTVFTPIYEHIHGLYKNKIIFYNFIRYF